MLTRWQEAQVLKALFPKFKEVDEIKPISRARVGYFMEHHRCVSENYNRYCEPQIFLCRFKSLQTILFDFCALSSEKDD